MAAQRHAEAGRDYHFVSMVPFRALQELAERARNSNDFTTFIHGSLPRSLDVLFSQVGNLYRGPEAAYRVLRRFHVRLIDETEPTAPHRARKFKRTDTLPDADARNLDALSRVRGGEPRTPNDAHD